MVREEITRPYVKIVISKKPENDFVLVWFKNLLWNKIKTVRFSFSLISYVLNNFNETYSMSLPEQKIEFISYGISDFVILRIEEVEKNFDFSLSKDDLLQILKMF